MIWDETLNRNLGILIWTIIGIFGFLLFEILNYLGASLLWIIFAELIWYAFDVFIAAWMWHVFKIRKSELPKIPTKIPTLVKVESTTIPTDLGELSDPVEIDPAQ